MLPCCFLSMNIVWDKSELSLIFVSSHKWVAQSFCLVFQETWFLRNHSFYWGRNKYGMVSLEYITVSTILLVLTLKSSLVYCEPLQYVQCIWVERKIKTGAYESTRTECTCLCPANIDMIQRAQTGKERKVRGTIGSLNTSSIIAG